MAAENQIQFYEAPFMYKIGEFQSNVNQDYHKLINTRPIKQPQMNTGFETVFSQSYNEKWDKSYFAITKREWFKWMDDRSGDHSIREKLRAVWLWMWYNINTNDYIVTDHIIVDGVRYAYCVDPLYRVWAIIYQKPSGYRWCEVVPNNIHNGNWEVLGMNELRWKWFYTTPCSYHKFQKLPTLQADKMEIINDLYIGNVVLEWWTTTAVLFNDKRERIPWIKTWDFINIYRSDNKEMVVGQALQVWSFDADNWWYTMGYWEWVGITDKSQEPVYNADAAQIGVLNKQGECDITILTELKNGFAFVWATSKGDDEFVMEFNGYWYREIMQTKAIRTSITSLCEDFGWLVYTTDKWYANFLRPHNNFSQSLGGTIYNTMKLYEDWDTAKGLRDYIVFFWPRSMGIAFKSYVDERWDAIRWVKILDRDLGYYDKDSVMIYDNGIYMVDNRKRFVKIDIQAQQVKNTEPIFEMQVTDMSLHRINTDLRNLSKERWDYVHLCKDDFRIYIIIEDNHDKVDDYSERDVYTKILVYEDELKYRHRRYVCDIDIRGFNEWIWFWEWLFTTEWNRDQWRPFKQIISLSFWDTSWFTRKEVLWMKLSFGYHSEMWTDTHLTFRADWGWYSQTVKMMDFHKTTSYIKAINALRWSWKTDKDLLETIYRSMPIGIGIYSGNGVWLEEDIERSLAKEFYQYCDYENTTIYDTENKCCKGQKPASRVSDNNCTMKPPKADEQNFWSDLFQYHYNIAKYATIPVAIWQRWQNFYIELVANNDDKMEFMGTMIGRSFLDNNFDSLYNMPYYQTTPEESLPWNIWN